MALDYDESEAESESEAVVEEGAATRFAAGFRPLRVCTRFLEHQMGRSVWGVPTAIGAPSHTHGLSFTRKPQSMNNSSPRTFLTEAVVAASGQEGVAGAAGRSEAAPCRCAEDREDGRGRPCALQRQVPAVLRVRSGRASASVRLQRVGLSSCDTETSLHSAHSTVRCSSWCCCHACSRLAVAGGRRGGAAGGLVCLGRG